VLAARHAGHRRELACDFEHAAAAGAIGRVCWRAEHSRLMAACLGAVLAPPDPARSPSAWRLPWWANPSSWRLTARPRQRVLVFGVPGAGKTMLLQRLSPVAPVGFGLETAEVTSRNLLFVANAGAEFGQHHELLWPEARSACAASAAAVIFVVDSAAVFPLDVAVEEFWRELGQPALPASAPVLLLANKQDRAGALPPPVVARRFRLGELRRRWCVQGCVAGAGDGVDRGLRWLEEQLS
jgi:signal recognition particle receptor subunit beta